MEKDQIISKLKANEQLFTEKGASKIALFGSYARNQQQQESDIDLLVFIDNNFKTFDNFISLSMLLENLLESKVDLITPESISTDFFDCIKDELIYAY